jgi:hypothetical protein
MNEHFDSAVRYGLWARLLNLALGTWLFASSFLLPRTSASGTNAWVIGMLIMSFSLWSLWVPQMRRVNAFAGVWVLLAAVVLPRSGATTLVHDLLAGLAVLLISLVPNRPVPTRAYV